ncbi:MAG: Imidazole glycerol phosphate synthase subunit HisH [Fimbriimonadaceae bacterium]|nr:Imidazole glycerol phosphate synthase subunit HisH [Fimbriimonadaceae bacterium]
MPELGHHIAVVTIVNYGVGNIGSIQNMCKKIGIPCQVSSSPEEIVAAESILLPGVGAFDAGMQRLNESGLTDALNEAVMRRAVPTLGICLGMQLMLDGSDEGQLPGLGWIKGRARRFPGSMPTEDGKTLKIPHMGWTDVCSTDGAKMYEGWEGECRFYFVHSFYAELENPGQVSGTAHYGISFTCSLEAGHIWGAQFHPEKSHRHGMRFFSNALGR